MARSADLIHSNSQVYRVYSRRLANPADQHIFIVAASKLTAFLSDSRAYYAEAQRSIVDVLEIACNSLKNVAPSVFTEPGSLDRSAIPADKAPLFDAFDKLANSVTPYLSLFADESLKNRLVSFLLSIGVSLPREATNVPPPNAPSQISATPSTGHQADPPASQAESASPIGPASPDIVDLTTGSPSNVEGPTSIQPTTLPAPARDRVSSPEAKGNDIGAVAPATSSRQATQSPVSVSLRLSPPLQAPVSGDVVNSALMEPNRTFRIPAPSLSTLPVSSSLQAQSSSLVSVPRVVPQSSQKIPENTSVTPSPASSNLTSRNLQSIPPSLVSTGEVEVAQVSQSVPPPQVQTPIQISASAPLFSTSSGQNEAKPPRRRQSAGLDFLQLDLQIAREKKMRAARLASEAHNSGSTTQASPGAVPSPSTKVTPVAATASPTSGTTDGLPNSPASQTFMFTVPVAAQAPPARTSPLTGIAHPHASTITSGVSNTTSPLQMTQTLSPGLVHRDLRQGIRTSSTSPRKLRIADRAPVPAPAPGSSRAPIVIDEDDSMSTPADEPMEVDAPMQALPQTEETAMVIDDQDVQGSNGDTRDDRKPQHDQEGKALTEQQNASVPEVASHHLVSDYVPSAAGTSGAGVIAAQSSSAPSTSTPLSFYATPPSAILSSGPPSLSASLCDKPSGAQVEQAKDGKEQGKTAEDSVERQGNGSSTLRRDSTHAAVSVISIPKGKVTEMAPATPTTITSTVVATGTSPVLGYPIPVQPVVVGLTGPGTITLGVRPPEKGSLGTSVDPPFSLRPAVWATSSNPSGKAVVSRLVPPHTPLHPSTESLSDMDVSCCSDAPPIEVLGARSGGSESNPSSDSRSVSPPSGQRFSEAGTEPVRAEEVEEDMVDELEPLFGTEMTVICMDRLYDIAGEFTWEFTLSQADWNRVSQWAGAPEIVDLDISQARCITLACYLKEELDPYATQERLTREQWFENVKPVSWANLPHYVWGVINDKITAEVPPYMSPDDLYDFSPFLRLGHNRICFTQVEGMADYVFVLHGHRPTRGQLVPLHTRWDQDRRFREKVASILDRPFIIEDW